MLYREIIAVCSEIHTKHINTQRGHNVELLNVKCGGTYSDHSALKGQVEDSYLIRLFSNKRSSQLPHATKYASPSAVPTAPSTLKQHTHPYSTDVTLTSQQVFGRLIHPLLIYSFHFLSPSDLIPSYCPKYTGTSPMFIAHISPFI
jgi:hypothetical protein